jgi:hypothetical protein
LDVFEGLQNVLKKVIVPSSSCSFDFDLYKKRIPNILRFFFKRTLIK